MRQGGSQQIQSAAVEILLEETHECQLTSCVMLFIKEVSQKSTKKEIICKQNVFKRSK